MIMFTCMWMFRRSWELQSLGQVQLQHLHIVLKTKNYSSASSWNTCYKTCRKDDDSNASIITCSYHLPSPQQVDHILSSDVSLRSRTFESSATVSDHWGLTATSLSTRMKNHRKSQAGNQSDGHVMIVIVSTMRCLLT